MIYNTSLTTGLRISDIALGTHYTLGDRCDLAASREVVKQAFDLGINLIDTANNYAQGHCEEYLGQLLANIHRSQFLVATKVYFPIFDGPNGRGLSRKHIIESTQQSLQRLQLDYIDILQLHRYDPETPLQETLETLKLLQQQGKILYWAVSNWSLANIEDAIALGMRPIWNQLPFNYFYASHAELCQQQLELGVDCLPYGCLAQGVFSEAYLEQTQPASSRLYHQQAKAQLHHNKQSDLDTLKTIHASCSRHGISLPEFSLAYTHIRLNPVSTLVGSYRTQHFTGLKNYTESRQSLLEKAREVLAEIENE